MGTETSKVVTTEKGQEGLKLYQSARPDLILLDVEMPEMNGYTFVLELAKLDGGKVIPILVMTVHEDTKPIFKFNNVKDYMIKPVDLDVLEQKINQHLSEPSA